MFEHLCIKLVFARSPMPVKLAARRDSAALAVPRLPRCTKQMETRRFKQGDGDVLQGRHSQTYHTRAKKKQNKSQADINND